GREAMKIACLQPPVMAALPCAFLLRWLQCRRSEVPDVTRVKIGFRDFRSKAALESWICWCPQLSEVRDRCCSYGARTSESGHQLTGTRIENRHVPAARLSRGQTRGSACADPQASSRIVDHGGPGRASCQSFPVPARCRCGEGYASPAHGARQSAMARARGERGVPGRVPGPAG